MKVDEQQTLSFGVVRCGICGGPVYYNPLAPPPPDGSPCLKCSQWGPRYVSKVHSHGPWTLNEILGRQD
jgi:hypothetical protein